MADWKDQLRDVYSKIQKDQKDKKGIKNKFDDVVGYKNKKGFNDTPRYITIETGVRDKHTEQLDGCSLHKKVHTLST